MGSQVKEWYQNARPITEDDKADFEVMLLDRQNTEDASMAIQGIVLNMLEKGFDPQLLGLLTMASKRNNDPHIRMQAMSGLVYILSTYGRIEGFELI